ncbi:lipopolysaccharide biosynthesis glycosyltransferase [Dysgonomonas alginatilytica]|uniref:Lipopolysaccharide biosynthesis glycosyltransferase n=1 Tax=Dysgonomonas alginatilytica TaxID=1605892 RepID=A0A2V3PL47_9BACT|nr:glycosyltransferase family 8 protein [Dysgonomonas alginatilytica]PXV60048.1 lipopolysaccharide biosynthesis glycosyltransferase [Dysgonomonas alginatilytica]
MIEIALCPDNNYIMPCGITIISLLENKKDTEIRIHIIGSDLGEDNKSTLKGIAEKYETEILFYDIENKYLDKFDIIQDELEYITASTYSRLFLHNILSDQIEKVIYLDCDLMVLGTLSEMWNIDIEGYSVGGVVDFPAFMPRTYEELKYSDQYSYINAGVLLINLKYWRDNNILNRCFEYAQTNHENLRFKDQDIINGVLHDSALLLPLRYNAHLHVFVKSTDFGKYEEQRADALKYPVIIHFTSSMKPWLRESIHPMTKKYRKYKAISPWKNTPIKWGDMPLRKKIRHYKRAVLYSLGIRKRNIAIK